jgi:Phage integrase SAM-like domain
MASLQAKHSSRCALGRAWTPFDQAAAGCTCPQGPIYYVVVREGDHAYKEVVGRDRQHAELALLRLEDAVDDGEYRPRPSIGFSDWADQWLDSLERKPSTIGSYHSTIVHAKGVFGGTRVRRIGAEDIAGFNMILRERGCSASTRAKHLRVLGACLQAAVFYRYTESNPVRDLPPAQRPRPERKEAAYFENDELPRLFRRLGQSPTGPCAWSRSRQECGRGSSSRFVGAMSISRRRSCECAEAAPVVRSGRRRTANVVTST